MSLRDFFVLNSNPMSASLKSLSIFVYSRSKVNVKYDFSTNEAKNKCNTFFSCDLTGQSISEIIMIIQGHIQGQKVNF